MIHPAESALSVPNASRPLPSLLTWYTTLVRDGFVILPSVIGEEQVRRLAGGLALPDSEKAVRSRGGVYAVRNLLELVPEVMDLALSLRPLVEPVLGVDAFPVRGILFDKQPETNWLVPWHQDLTIAVRERKAVTGFGPWSEKAGVPHVQSPASVLERMLTVRIHLDECGAENGPLRVLPGSHRWGRLSAERIQAAQQSVEAATCEVPLGGALLMRPLLLHASSPARSPMHRRVIHLDYAAEMLPGGLEWYTAALPHSIS